MQFEKRKSIDGKRKERKSELAGKWELAREEEEREREAEWSDRLRDGKVGRNESVERKSFAAVSRSFRVVGWACEAGEQGQGRERVGVYTRALWSGGEPTRVFVERKKTYRYTWGMDEWRTGGSRGKGGGGWRAEKVREARTRVLGVSVRREIDLKQRGRGTKKKATLTWAARVAEVLNRLVAFANFFFPCRENCFFPTPTFSEETGAGHGYISFSLQVRSVLPFPSTLLLLLLLSRQYSPDPLHRTNGRLVFSASFTFDVNLCSNRREFYPYSHKFSYA